MKIVHCCLSNFYIDNYNYQENVLPKQNRLDGHDVSIIASTETYINNTQLGYVEPRDYVNEDGIPVRRIPYRRIPISFLRRKIRSYPGVYQILEEQKPDVILFHGIPAWELKTVAKYKRKHPEMKLYADSHEDFHNSAKTFLSKNILHKMFYKWIVRGSYQSLDKILYYSLEAKDFLNTLYGLPFNKMEFYPLGGTVIEEKEHQTRRQKVRKGLNLSDNHILIIHSGKLGRQKRTEDILQALARVPSEKLCLVIAGTIPEEMKPVLEPLIVADKRVCFVGWKTADELIDLLCAADLYIQPGSQSATMQNAICCGCPVAIYPYKSHEPYLKNNGYYVKSAEDMEKVFQEIIDEPNKLRIMSDNSMKIARELLDYKKLAARLYE
ncbi:MAG: glycosyltransferase family 4 protein [Syntrophomonas sp.]